MRIGFTELLVVFFVALLVLGPDKLPGYAKKLGEALSAFRKASDEATREIRENIVEPLEEAQRPLREAMEPVEELDRAVRGNVREVQNSLRDVGKRKPPSRTGGEDAETAPEVKEPPLNAAEPAENTEKPADNTSKVLESMADLEPAETEASGNIEENKDTEQDKTDEGGPYETGNT